MKSKELAKIAVGKSLLKEYGNSSDERIVYMKDDTEFQIQLFNPYDYVIGVSFEFNGKHESYNLLVLRPGERVWLERYLDDNAKMVFSTYEVGVSKEVKDAIKNNGKIKIQFYKEKENRNSWYSCNINSISVPNKSSEPNTWPTYPDNTWYTTCGDSLSVNNYNVQCSSMEMSTSATYNAKTNFTNSIETGRIEKGNASSQRFKNVYKEFDSWPFRVEIINILPESVKPVTNKDLQKRYCHNCGRKVNPKFKYCPFCGTKQ